MPELPEVETIRIGLEKLLPGRKVESVKYNWPKSFPNSAEDTAKFLAGTVITGVDRRAKVLIIHLSSAYSLVIHLKMTGQMVFRSSGARFGAGHPSSSLAGELPDRSTRVILTFTDGSRLFFNDQRKFGWMRLLPALEISNLDFFRKVGPEPLASDFTASKFAARLARRSGSGIKAVLLDQTVVAGVGNIYADESLWMAKIHPLSKVRDLSPGQIELLYKKLRAVLRLSIAKGGSTDRNYVDSEGKKGSYLSFAKVFRREGLPCPRCGAVIIKMRAAGRGTHVCPVCQVY